MADFMSTTERLEMALKIARALPDESKMVRPVPITNLLLDDQHRISFKYRGHDFTASKPNSYGDEIEIKERVEKEDGRIWYERSLAAEMIAHIVNLKIE